LIVPGPLLGGFGQCSALQLVQSQKTGRWFDPKLFLVLRSSMKRGAIGLSRGVTITNNSVSPDWAGGIVKAYRMIAIEMVNLSMIMILPFYPVWIYETSFNLLYFQNRSALVG
jgi:hypothetical protein